MIPIIKSYEWQCMECKTCVKCMKPHDEVSHSILLLLTPLYTSEFYLSLIAVYMWRCK